MMRKYLPSLLILCLLTFSCSKKPNKTSKPESMLIEISKAQFTSEKMAFGEALPTQFTNEISFRGKIVPKSNGFASLSLPLPGIVMSIHCKPGQLVKKGQSLLSIQGNELIDLQKEFAESAATLKQLELDYRRAKELFEDKIGSKKEYLKTESNFLLEKASYIALKLKLENLGLEVTKIENSSFYSYYSLRAPINGTISKLDASIGQYTEQQKSILEIIDPDGLHLKLAIYESDVMYLSAGQIVKFYLAGQNTQACEAQLISIGKNVQSDTKTIACYASIQKLNGMPVYNNQFVEGQIITECDSAFALPEEALLKSENKIYVLRLVNEDENQYYFQKDIVEINRTENGKVELIEKPKDGKLLVSGVYNVLID